MSLAERLNGILWRLRAMRRLWRPGAQPAENFLPPIPIPDPTGGALDHPGPGYEFEDGTVGFNGWVAFASGSPVARVEGTLDGIAIGRARTCISRPDIDELKNLPLAELSGFEHVAEVSVLPEDERLGAKELTVTATSLDGERFAFDPIPVFLRPRKSHLSEPMEAPVPRAITASPRLGKPSTLVFAHQLTLGGAQLYLLDLLRELRRRDVGLTVVSTMDGPLRRQLEEIDIPVHLTSMGMFERLEAREGRIDELVAWARPGEFEVVLINTATSGSSFGAEVAAALEIPAIWAIHESFPPSLLWADLRKKVRERTEAAIAEASWAIFEAEATQSIFEPLVPPERCLTLPYGVDPEPIERERRSLDVHRARRDVGISADAEVILCVGTVEPRKAQVPLAQAFSLVADRHPSARLVFVGGRKKHLYTEDLEDVIAASPARDQIDLIPITPDVQTWYGIADILVCASDVESLPRTVLEAMLWETPVLATDVFGLPELIVDDESGWLCETRDLEAMAAGLDRALNASPSERRRIGSAGRELVERRHSVPEYGARVHELLTEAAKRR